MKELSIRRGSLAILTAGMILICSCAEQIEPGTFRNDSIEEQTLVSIDEHDQKLINALKDGDSKGIKSLMSKELLSSSTATFSDFIERTQKFVESKEFTVVDRFHRVDEKAGSTVAVFSGTDSDEDYIIQYTSPSSESVVSVLKPKRDGDEYLLMAIYAFNDEQWELVVLQFERYTLSGYNAIDLFRDAQSDYEQGHLVNAFGRMLLSQSVAHPAGDYFEFRLQSEMDAFNQSISAEAQEAFPMPIEVEHIPTKPTIFQIIPQRVDDQICTMIKYTSDINITDTTALAAENKALHEHCRSVFNGIDNDVPFIFYRAFNEMPQQDVSTPYFGFVRPVDERFM